MKTRMLGKTGIKVGAIGLGGMPMSLEGRPTEKESIAVIHRALDLGVTLIDTADSYCIDEHDKHHNERLIAKALATYRGTASVIVATKGGLMRPDGDWTTNGDPTHLRKTIRESFTALGGKKPIPLWQLHAMDAKFPLEQSLGPVCEAVQEGLISLVGLSNVSVDDIKRAQKMVPIVSVQNQYNPWFRRADQDGVLNYCEKEGLSFLPWSPLGGMSRAKSLGRIAGLNRLAQAKGVTPQRWVLAWLLAKSSCMIPIPGARRIQSVEDSLAAFELSLTPNEVKAFEQSL